MLDDMRVGITLMKIERIENEERGFRHRFVRC